MRNRAFTRFAPPLTCASRMLEQSPVGTANGKCVNGACNQYVELTTASPLLRLCVVVDGSAQRAAESSNRWHVDCAKDPCPSDAFVNYDLWQVLSLCVEAAEPSAQEHAKEEH